MSAFLVKDKVLDFLRKGKDGCMSYSMEYHYKKLIKEIESGRFDWTSEGE